MGLDVFIETKDANIDNCYKISRMFCNQLSLLDDSDEDSLCAIHQVYMLYKMESTILSKMNTWALESPIRYGDSSNLLKEEIDNYYASAFQASSVLLENLETLYHKISLNPELITKVHWKQDWEKKYFERFFENVGDYVVV